MQSLPPIRFPLQAAAATPAPSSRVSQPFIALYDAQGVLRCTGSDQGECLAYAELFALDPAVCSLVSLS